MRMNWMATGVAFVASAMALSPAQASYTSKCNKLISAWKACGAAGGNCELESKNIAEQCKCHRLKQGEWKLIVAAVENDRVCRSPIDPPIIKEPPQPPNPPMVHEKKQRPKKVAPPPRVPN